MMAMDVTNELRASARTFVKRYLIPREQEVEESGEVPVEIVELMRDAGFFGMRLPEAYGGMALSFGQYASVVKEFGRTSWAFFGVFDDNNGMGSELILASGSQAVKDRVLPELATGKALASFALTEPEAGSDAASIKTTAQRLDDGFLVTGRKQFISNACKSTYFTVIARSVDATGASLGHSAFLVDRRTPGLTIGPAERLMSWRGACQHEVVLDNCVLERSSLLGDEGEGLRGALDALKTGRLIVAAWALGAAQRALELGAAYAATRRQFGVPIGDFQGVQWHVADAATQLAAANALLDKVVDDLDRGLARMRDAAMVKLLSTETASRVADSMIQVHGGVGLSRDLPLERILRDLRACRIIEGTSEIQRSIIARSLIKEAAQGRPPV
jgi:acyl-CoA dehydrogenase